MAPELRFIDPLYVTSPLKDQFKKNMVHYGCTYFMVEAAKCDFLKPPPDLTKKGDIWPANHGII